MSVADTSFFSNSHIARDTKSEIVIISSAVTIIGVAVLAIGLLSHYQILTGFNAVTQKTLIGIGAGVGIIATAVSMVSYCSMVHTFKTRLASYDDVLKELRECIDQGNDPLATIQKLAKQLSHEKLQKYVQTKYQGHTDALFAAKMMVKQADEYLSLREGVSPTFKSRIRGILDTLITVIDSILTAFGIADFFRAPESELHGDFKFQKILMLISLFTLLTATLLPMLGVTTGASLVGGVMLLICAMSLIWPHIRPQPSRIPEGENWSKQIREGKLKPIQGRKNDVHQIAEALKSGQHPLLIGPSGVGKTQTARAFVQALEDGEFPELKGMTVFYFNTANLVTSKEIFGGGNKILKRISDTIGQHRKNCILIFDEIHLAYRVKKSQSAIGEQLKTYLDDKADNFPHVIGLTTSEEYYRDIYQSNSAGDRRFKKIEIQSMDDEATGTILNQLLIQDAPDVIVEKRALDYLIEKTKGLPQPLSARSILLQCISYLSLPKSSKMSIETEKHRTSLLHAATRRTVIGSASIADETQQKLKEIEKQEKELTKLEDKLKKEEAKLRLLAQTKEFLIKTREAKHRLAREVSVFKLESLSTREKAQISEFILLKYFLEGALENKIRTQGEEVKVETTVSKELVDRVLREETENAQRKEKALNEAIKSLEKRNNTNYQK